MQKLDEMASTIPNHETKVPPANATRDTCADDALINL
jgi:hypothetical protein